MLLSVIIPVYNAENYVSDCIESIIKQNEVEYELLLIDDGSIDKSREICDYYAEKYDFVKVYHIKNGGPSKARNFGIAQATGKYIQFIDADDEIKEGCFGQLKRIIDEQEYDLLVYGADIYNNNKKLIKEMVAKSVNGKYCVFEMLENFKLDDKAVIFNYIWNKWYKRSVIINNKITFDENVILGEDFLFNCQMFQKCAYSLFFEQKSFYKYYVRGSESLTGKFNMDELNRRRKMKSSFYELFVSFDLDAYGREIVDYIEGEMGYISIRTIVLKNCKIGFQKKVQYVSGFLESEYRELIVNYLRKNQGVYKKVCYFLVKNKMKRTFVLLNGIVNRR